MKNVEQLLRESRREMKETLRRIMLKWGSKAEVIARKYNQLNLHIHQVARYLEAFGEEQTGRLLESFSRAEVMETIRVNTLLTTPQDLSERLQAKGFRVSPHPYLDYGLQVHEKPYSLGATHEYLLGLYTIQGPASMLAVPALDPRNKARIADACAGAGVKTTQIAQHAPNSLIVAVDINRRKLLALKNNASRLAAFNIVALQGDARRLASLGKFDYILLDAPCSGEGLLHTEKGRWPRTIDDILSRIELQLELLHAAVKALEPGGVLLYATCSISVEENEYVVSKILEIEPALEVEEPPISYGANGVEEYSILKLNPTVKYCRRFLPHIHRTEGFTICRLKMSR